MTTERIPLRVEDGRMHGLLLPHASPGAPLLACIAGGGCSGRYFEAATPSTASMAHARGFSVLLIDRPGYGASAPITGATPIRDALPGIAALIGTAAARLRARDIGLIGHSIGGAVALLLASDQGSLPLRAVAVSGIGDEPPAATRAWATMLGGMVPRPNFSADLFFGAPGTYNWRGPAALRRAAEPWRMSEVVEIVEGWPQLWPTIAGRIVLPVHLRLAERDGIWESGASVVKRMAAALSMSAKVDAAVLREGGHAYEFHLKGPELVAAQLEFLANACRPPISQSG